MKLYFATGNRHKYEEASRVLAEYGVELVQLTRVPKLEIQSGSLAEIALTAARAAYLELGEPIIVEDAGLYIEALNGFPGPYSSYVYKTLGCKGILKLLEGVKRRDAYFESAVAAVIPPYEEVFVARIRGIIAREPRGGEGFGFDPIFVPRGDDRTFAEMGLEEKNRYSHRARALRMLGEWLRSRKIKRAQL